MRKVLFYIYFLILLSACVPQESAQIEYNHAQLSNDQAPKINIVSKKKQDITSRPILIKEQKYDNTSGILHEKKPTVLKKTPGSKEVILPNTIMNKDQIIYHEVQEGETLEDISAKYGQSLIEVASFNQLTTPYELEESQVIKIKKKKNSAIIANKSVKNSTSEDITHPNRPEFDQPLSGKIISNFGDQTPNGANKGINITAEKGTKISSISNGKIIYSGFGSKFGNLIIVKVDKVDIYVAYAHMEELIHKKGEIVKRGEAIGYVGSTGEIDVPQLYLAMRKNKLSINPTEYIEFDR